MNQKDRKVDMVYAKYAFCRYLFFLYICESNYIYTYKKIQYKRFFSHIHSKSLIKIFFIRYLESFLTVIMNLKINDEVLIKRSNGIDFKLDNKSVVFFYNSLLKQHYNWQPFTPSVKKRF